MLTLHQLYNLGESESINIFEYLSLPEGSPFDKDTIINTILMKCGLNIPMYADPFTMRSAIDIWSKKNQYTFEHIAKIYKADYSPIENKDYTEETTTNRDRTLTDNTIGTNKTAENLNSRFDEDSNEHINQTSSRTDATTGSSADITTGSTSDAGSQNVCEQHEGTDTTTNTTSAFNSSTYEPDNQSGTLHGHKITTVTATEQHTQENTSSNSTNESSTNSTGESSTGTTKDHNSTTNSTKNININSSNNKDVDEAEITIFKTHQHGNVGITSNVALQVEEYSLMNDYNPYSFIAGLFENELTLCVY